MSLFEKTKTVTDTAAQRAAELREHAASVASSVAERAASLGEQTTGIANNLRERAGAISSGLADAVLESAKLALSDFNAALPVLKRAGYTVSEVSVEFGVPPKLVAVFALAEVVPDDQVEQMLKEYADAKLARMLVHALVRAHKLQGMITIGGGLHPKGIAVEMGLTPSVVVKFGR
jgi:hypothetical protein